jgi:purine-binding chemotaxis protein CheW
MNQLDDNQFLTFSLGQEAFGIGILHIKEIKEFGGVTQIPMMPHFVRGVINLRGNVVPVIDLGVRFGRGDIPITRKTCIIIVEINTEDELIDIGILVESVNEVLEIPPDKIEPAPSFGSKIRTDFIQGIGKSDNRFIIILNVQKVLSVDELSHLSAETEKIGT